MKINFDQKFQHISEGETPVSLTLSAVAFQSLNYVPRDGAARTLEWATRRGSLSIKVLKGGEIDVTTADIALMQENLAMVFAPVIVSQAFDMLEGQAGE